MGSPFLLFHPNSPSIIFFTLFPVPADFDLPSILHFSLDLVIMILIKFRPLLPSILLQKSLVPIAYFPEIMSLNEAQNLAIDSHDKIFY